MLSFNTQSYAIQKYIIIVIIIVFFLHILQLFLRSYSNVFFFFKYFKLVNTYYFVLRTFSSN